MFDTTNALCKEIGSEIFFPEKHEAYLTTYAKWVCRRCPLIKECREYAMQDIDIVGIWGGTSTLERNNLRWRKDERKRAS
jgi:WhiB family redox-sensing transcriptional regulator